MHNGRNIIEDKGLNLFDECAAWCVYLSPQEEEIPLLLKSRIYTSGNIKNSQGIPTEINTVLIL